MSVIKDIYRALRFALGLLVFAVLVVILTPIMLILWLADRGRA